MFKDMIYDEASRVPLAIRVPWLSGNREENRVVSALDVTATIVDACGLEAGRPLLGSSLLPIIEDGAAPWEGAAFVESHGSPGARSKGRPAFKGLRVGGDEWGHFSYAWYPDTDEVELYDREADPAQLENVADRVEYAAVREALEARLAEFLGRPGYGA
jgi:arylsulfatase A-like enzyme